MTKQKTRNLLITAGFLESRGSGLNRRPAHYEWHFGELSKIGVFLTMAWL
jgi:hypothetical protein